MASYLPATAGGSKKGLDAKDGEQVLHMAVSKTWRGTPAATSCHVDTTHVTCILPVGCLHQLPVGSKQLPVDNGARQRHLRDDDVLIFKLDYSRIQQKRTPRLHVVRLKLLKLLH